MKIPKKSNTHEKLREWWTEFWLIYDKEIDKMIRDIFETAFPTKKNQSGS